MANIPGTRLHNLVLNTLSRHRVGAAGAALFIFAATVPFLNPSVGSGHSLPNTTRPAGATPQGPGKTEDPPAPSAKDKPENAPSECFAIPTPGGVKARGTAEATPTALTATMIAANENENVPNSNNTFGTATPLPSKDVRMKGYITPAGDVDFYSFTGVAGERVYAAVMTSASSNASVDSVLDLIDTDGTTVIENDDNDGSFGATSSSIAGRMLATGGTKYLRVRHSSATTQLRPYFLYVKVQGGAPTAETESNDTFPGQALPMSGWVSGSTSSTTDVDFYSISLNAGDTVFLSLDIDPERDNVQWNGQLGLGQFGTPPLTLVVNDTSTGSVANPLSEAYFMTVKDAGTYGILVGLPTGGTTFGTYHLSVSVLPAPSSAGCTSYASTNVPVTIPTGPAIVTSTLTVPGNPRIRKLTVTINLTHNFMADLDVELTSPTGNTVGLFSDIGSVTVGAQTTMDMTLDDDAGVPPSFVVVQGLTYQPELAYRLDWFRGQPAGGTWTLTIRDDAGGDGGTLTGWSLNICDDTAPMPSTTVFSTDFESGAAGFTHSGTADEWELGTPTFAPIADTNSGVNCWKTDLDNTYNASCNQDLLSPNIDLTGFMGPIELDWAMKFQIERPDFDHFFVEVRQVGGATPRRVYEWEGADMVNNVGNPTVTVQEAGGWGLYRADISSFAGQNIEVRFHLDTDTTVQRAGVAIDDVAVKGTPVCVSPPTANAGPDQTICATGSATLAANVPGVGTGTWSVVSGPNANPSQFGNVNAANSTFTPAGGAGAYTLRWTISDSSFCSSSTDDVVVTVDAPPSASNAGPDQTACVTTTSVTLAANLPAVGSGMWSVVSGPSMLLSQFSDQAANNATFTPAGGPGAYTLRWTIMATAACPPANDTVVVTFSVCGAGTVYVADTQNNRIQKFDGLSWTVVVGNGTPGTAPNRCNLPKAVAASADGQRIYVADTGNNRITFSTDGGANWAVFASTGIGLGQVRGPQEVELDGAGNLYVADALNERVLRFAGGLPGTGVVLASSGTGAGQVKSPRGLAADGVGNLYVTDKVLHRLLRIANASTVAVANTGFSVTGSQGLGLSSLNGPEGCGVDASGNVYVADTLNERVIQFPGGTTPGVVMTDGAGATLGKVNRPEGVTVTTFTTGALAGQPFLIVGDTMNNRIQGRPIASPTWQLVGTPNTVGSGVGQFRNPSKIR